MYGATAITTRPATVVVIGAGVIGLSTALKLQSLSQGRYNIVIIARDWPTSTPGAPPLAAIDYASMWAGAHVRPIPGTSAQLSREAALLRATVGEFAALQQAEPWCGITRTMGIEMLDEPDEGYRSLDADTFLQETGLGGFKQLQVNKMPDGVKLAFEYETFCINPPVYCRFLLRKLLLGGAKTLDRDLGSAWEAYDAAEEACSGAAAKVVLVVNASGMGFGDDKCFPIRGQTMVTNMTHMTRTVTRQQRDGTWSFLIPRFLGGGTIVGGTKEVGDMRSEADAATRERLLAGGKTIAPYACTDDDERRCASEVQASSEGQASSDKDEFRVVADVVGRRPARHGGMRMQVQRDAQGRAVLHAYGAGGRGYELSWGIASEVARLAEPLVTSLEGHNWKHHVKT